MIGAQRNDKVCAFHEKAKKEGANEDRWQPAPLLEKLAKSGGKSGDYRADG